MPHVHTFTEQVAEITKQGFIDQRGQEYEVDVIICATGFDTSWVPRFPIVHDGKNAQDFMRERTLSYISYAIPEGSFHHTPPKIAFSGYNLLKLYPWKNFSPQLFHHW